MLFAIQHPKTKVFARFEEKAEGLPFILAGTERRPTIFESETKAHEARRDVGLQNSYDVVKLVVER